MREIEFRFYDKKLDKIISRKPLYNDFAHKDIIPLQYIGVKDVNGKKIFEGDIVEFYEDIGVKLSRGVIEFEDGNFRLKSETFIHYRIIDYKLTIVDNIYKKEK